MYPRRHPLDRPLLISKRRISGRKVTVDHRPRVDSSRFERNLFAVRFAGQQALTADKSANLQRCTHVKCKIMIRRFRIRLSNNHRSVQKWWWSRNEWENAFFVVEFNYAARELSTHFLIRSDPMFLSSFASSFACVHRVRAISGASFARAHSTRGYVSFFVVRERSIVTRVWFVFQLEKQLCAFRKSYVSIKDKLSTRKTGN